VHPTLAVPRRRAASPSVPMRAVAGLCGCLIGLCAATVECAADDCGSDRVAYLLTRALAYDDNLKARAGDQLTIAALYRAGIAESERFATSMSEAFTTHSGATVQGLPLRVRPLAFEDVSSLLRAIETQRIGGIFLTVCTARWISSASRARCTQTTSIRICTSPPV
jgi:hypothetical protein